MLVKQKDDSIVMIFVLDLFAGEGLQWPKSTSTCSK